jgi:hypothetical protein
MGFAELTTWMFTGRTGLKVEARMRDLNIIIIESFSQFPVFNVTPTFQ